MGTKLSIVYYGLFGQIAVQFQCSTQRAVADQLLLIEHVDSEIFAVVLGHVVTAASLLLVGNHLRYPRKKEKPVQ